MEILWSSEGDGEIIYRMYQNVYREDFNNDSSLQERYSLGLGTVRCD